MVRVTIEMVPGGREEKAYPIGLIEIGNDGGGTAQTGNYRCVIKKSFPWKGRLVEKWRSGVFEAEGEDEEVLAGRIEGFSRQSRGPYDLLFRALKACGLAQRN